MTETSQTTYEYCGYENVFCPHCELNPPPVIFWISVLTSDHRNWTANKYVRKSILRVQSSESHRGLYCIRVFQNVEANCELKCRDNHLTRRAERGEVKQEEIYCKWIRARNAKRARSMSIVTFQVRREPSCSSWTSTVCCCRETWPTRAKR